MEKFLRYIPYGFLVLSSAGFLDAAYLVVLHYRGIAAQCLLVQGCDEVLSGPYAVLGGMPLAIWGVFYYAVIFTVSLLYLESRNKWHLFAAAYGTVVGFLASLVLLYLQIFVIEALCFYCLVSALISTLLFVSGVIVVQYKEVV